jgi:hypothetical protein
MVRRWEHRRIFTADTDRTDLVARLATLVAVGAWTVYAWALFLITPISSCGRASGRSPGACGVSSPATLAPCRERVGHLFQNRYKSIVVEEESYLLELVRYLHLNPLRARVVPDLRTLAR